MALLTVFNKGNSKGLTATIPRGGHRPPNSTVGDKALELQLTYTYIFFIYTKLCLIIFS